MEGVVINATGMGAKNLTGDEEINHYKGHTVLLQPDAASPRLAEALSVDDLIIMPREDGTIVVGALYIDNPDRPVPEEVEAKELIERLSDLATKTSQLVEGLDPNLFDNSAILQHSSGYRVVIESGGIHVQPDENLEHVLHAYGFSGIGWSVGPAFAKRIADQAAEIHDRISLKGGV